MIQSCGNVMTKGQTDRQTDRQTEESDFVGSSPTNVRRSINWQQKKCSVGSQVFFHIKLEEIT